MRQERWLQVKRILEQALEKDPAERALFLDLACLDDAELRRDVESLIALDGQAESFLETPVAPLKERNVSVLKNQSGGAADMLDRLIGEVIDDKYRIEELLGHGGMGAVYKAVHIGTDRTVAVKIIIPQFTANREFIERFKREAKAAGRLRHPNVVNVTDFGFAEIDEKQLAYLVMEYLDGFTLGDLMEKKGKLPLGFAVDVTEQTCLALNAAHRQGIIHRDLKPDNIWLEPNGRGGFNVKILDFGLAKIRQTDFQASMKEATAASRQSWGSSKESDATLQLAAEAETNFAKAPTAVLGEEDTLKIEQTRTGDQGQAQTDGEGLTRVGAILGTPLYMSPEQCKGEPSGASSDVYSLGVIVYAMLAGETPFKGSPFFMIGQHIDAPPPPLRNKRRDIPRSAAQAVMSALKKNPADRPSTAMAFATVLRAAAEGESLILEQASELYRKHSYIFKNISTGIYLTAAVVNGLLLLGLTLLPPSLQSRSVYVGYWLFSFLFILFANTTNAAACAFVVERLRTSPANPVGLRTVFAALLQRLGALAVTSIKGVFELFSLSFIRSGLQIYAGNALAAPVVMLEEKQGREALTRAQSLAGPLRSIALQFQARDLFAGSISVLMLMILLLWSGLILDVQEKPEAVKRIIWGFVSLIPTLFISLFYPRVAVALAVLYSKTRQAGGEALGETLSQDLEPSDAPWRKKASYKRTIAFLTAPIAVAWWLFMPIPIDLELKSAAASDFTDSVKALIILGADANARDKYGSTVLSIAAQKGHTDAVKALIAGGADVNVEISHNDITALSLAANYGRVDAMKALFAAGAIVGKRDLELATVGGNSDAVKLLLAAGGDAITKARLNSALMAAADLGRTEAAKVLIDAGADVNAEPAYGDAVLLRVVESENIETVKLLISAGADLKVKNKAGKTALMLASENKLEGIVELLKAAGAEE